MNDTIIIMFIDLLMRVYNKLHYDLQGRSYFITCQCVLFRDL